MASIKAIQFQVKDHDWGNGPGRAIPRLAWAIDGDLPYACRGRGVDDNSYSYPTGVTATVAVDNDGSVTFPDGTRVFLRPHNKTF